LPEADVPTTRFVFLLALAILSSCGHAAHGTSRPNENDRAFIAAMIPHHELGIRMMDNAVPRVDDVRLRRMIFKMSAYHDADMHSMEHLLEEWRINPMVRFPGWVDPDALDALSLQAGRAYDVGWLALMIEHHQGAVALAEKQAARGMIDDLRSLAGRIEATQRAEIAAMTELRSLLCSAEPATTGCGGIAGPEGRG
jgi:uncharacterized protein (DUF305 family)